ncbi:VTT domain-containing protein [Patescibacteria group bacterium]|nr:VTT domain-containing protein [Patescibacteria group bacterium]MBU1868477.1 VTT domain-containing protein [Patescibacteria group bacterium]
MKKTIIITIAILTSILILASLLVWQNIHQINQQLTVENIEDVVEGFGIFAPIFYVLVCASTNVFSPLVITPFWIAGILIFKLPWAFIYIYAANLIGHSFNFLIAKRWGRKLIVKFTGKQSLQKIDEFTEIVGWKMVFLIRLLGGAATDYISYALGLTNISFASYFCITAIAFLPWLIINYWLIKEALQGSVSVLVRNFSILAIASYVFTAILSIIIYRAKKKK